MKKVFFLLLMILPFPFVYGQSQNSGDANTGNNQGENFIGDWHIFNGTSTITIQKEQDHFTLEDNGKKSILKFKNNELKGSDPSVHVIYNSMTGHIFWQKKEYEYVSNNPAGTDQPAEVTAPQTPNTEPSNNSEENNYDVVLGANFPIGLVKDNLTASLSTQESVLFKFLGDDTHPNKLVFLDHNFHLEDPNVQFVANQVYYSIVNTKRFDRIFSDKYPQYGNDTIFYIISYSDISATADYVGTKVDQYGNPLPDYVARTSCTVSIADYNGKVVASGNFRYGDKPIERVHIFRYATGEIAIEQSAKKLGERISDFFIEKIPIVTTVVSVDDANRNGEAKTIILKGGENIGLSKQTGFRIMYKDKQIGEVKVKSVDEKTSVCKVLDGGNVIAVKLAADKKLKAISE